jgi:GTP1/Obg family GTP-binding protein
MSKKDEIAVFLFDPEKKEYYTTTQARKLLNEIKSQLNKKKYITVIISETDNDV